MRYYLSLGSNVGNRENYLNSAIQYLVDSNVLIAKSSIYETEPVGMKEGTSFFYNQAIIVESEMLPEVFLSFAKHIEQIFGRENKGEKKDRTIDIDLIFCDQLIIDTPLLKIPHPEIQLRNFVLDPLLEICPNFFHPIFRKTLSTLKQECLDINTTKKI